MKVLYIYSGKRKRRFDGKIGRDYPDTQFYGLNHLSKFGINANYREMPDFGFFRLKHFLSFFLTRGYDIVFGSSLLYALFWKKIFDSHAKFVILNIGLTRVLASNRNNPFKLKIILWLLKSVTTVVCLSNNQRKYLEEQFNFLQDKVFFVPLGVDVKYYQPIYEGRKNYILSVGRDNGRDYKTVIETAILIPNKEFHIVCSRRNLENINDIPKNIKIFYDLPFPELNRKYQEAEILLLITHNDSFGDGADCSGQTVLLDAMANGLPIIVSRKDYLTDYIRDKKEAIFVDFYNPSKIKIAIESLLNNHKFKREIAVRARQRVEGEFSTEKMAERLSDIFRSLS